MAVARDPCSAKRRDGAPCGAPAIPHGTVCGSHGGAAPQVQIAAQRMRLRLALWCRNEDLQAGLDTSARFDLLCRFTAAQRALEQFEAKVIEVAEMRVWIAAARAKRGEAHLPPWQPSADDLAILGVRPKRRRPRAS
jgi:hypothetical protein